MRYFNDHKVVLLLTFVFTMLRSSSDVAKAAGSQKSSPKKIPEKIKSSFFANAFAKAKKDTNKAIDDQGDQEDGMQGYGLNT